MEAQAPKWLGGWSAVARAAVARLGPTGTVGARAVCCTCVRFKVRLYVRTTMLLAGVNAWQTCTVRTQVGIVAALDVWRGNCTPNNQCGEHTSAATISGPLVRSRMSVDNTRSTEHRAGIQGGEGNGRRLPVKRRAAVEHAAGSGFKGAQGVTVALQSVWERLVPLWPLALERLGCRGAAGCGPARQCTVGQSSVEMNLAASQLAARSRP